jgi:hypothetical protein
MTELGLCGTSIQVAGFSEMCEGQVAPAHVEVRTRRSILGSAAARPFLEVGSR